MLERGARNELASFLRTRRARLVPAEFGFPRMGRRRTPGLRREEVAVLAGVGLTWYTWLEQGKEIQVSTAFLENLANALKFTEAERSHLFALAQHRLPPLPRLNGHRDATEGVQSMLDAIEAPAYARNSCFDVIAWNAANTRMFGDFARIPAAERNVIRLMFLRSYHRKTMPNWNADARSLLANFRVSFGQAPDAAPFQTLISDLEESSPEFSHMWAAHEVSDAGEGVTEFLSPRQGRLLFQHHILVPEASPGLRIVIFIALAKYASHPDH
jgi:transcriptional regulator with XRE-family HTH domain